MADSGKDCGVCYIKNGAVDVPVIFLKNTQV